MKTNNFNRLYKKIMHQINEQSYSFAKGKDIDDIEDINMSVKGEVRPPRQSAEYKTGVPAKAEYREVYDKVLETINEIIPSEYPVSAEDYIDKGVSDKVDEIAQAAYNAVKDNAGKPMHFCPIEDGAEYELLVKSEDGAVMVKNAEDEAGDWEEYFPNEHGIPCDDEDSGSASALWLTLKEELEEF